MRMKRREGWLQCCVLLYDQARCMHPPSVECYAIQAFSIASDFDRPLADTWRNKSDHDEKNLHLHTIPSFASSKSPFYKQLGSRETPHASQLETEVKRCPRRNQHRAARAAWVRCEPSTLRHDHKTDELARSSRRRVQPFLLSHCHSEDNRTCLLGPLCNSSRKEQRVPCKTTGEQELGIIQEARTWCPIPMRANFLHRLVELIHERIESRAHH